jgi:hypothetical protein
MCQFWLERRRLQPRSAFPTPDFTDVQSEDVAAVGEAFREFLL